MNRPQLTATVTLETSEGAVPCRYRIEVFGPSYGPRRRWITTWNAHHSLSPAEALARVLNDPDPFAEDFIDLEDEDNYHYLRS